MATVFVPSSVVKNRLELADLCKSKGLTWAAVEVGVWRGDFADPFYKRWGGRRMYLVDPWEKLPDSEYADVRNRDFDPNDYHHVLRRLHREISSERVVLLRMKSKDALDEFEDGTLDFVYVDANHSKEYVSEDLRGWWGKLKPGGILAGHDLFSIGHPGVTEAVFLFCEAKDLTAYMVYGDYNEHRQLVNAHSWYVLKPE